MNRKYLVWGGIAIALSTAFVNGTAAQTGPVTVRDWTVRCTDELYCIARTTGYAENGDELTFKLERGPKYDSSVYITSGPTHMLELGMRVDVDVTDLAEPYGIYGTVKKVYKGNEMAFSGDARRKIIRKMREGRQGKVTIDFGGPVGRVVYDVSLSGVTSALLFMDQAQGRLDRYDAAIAWGGENTPSEGALTGGGVPVAAALPEAPAQSSSSENWRQSGSWVYAVEDLPFPVADIGQRQLECDLETTMSAIGGAANGFFYNNVLYVIPCQMGDRNFDSYVTAYSENDPSYARLYEFESPPGFNAPLRKTIFNPSWDGETQRLTSTVYYGPDGDCGVYELFQYDEGNDFFELLEYREKPSCDGRQTQPEDYPMVWSLAEMGG